MVGRSAQKFQKAFKTILLFPGPPTGPKLFIILFNVPSQTESYASVGGPTPSSEAA